MRNQPARFSSNSGSLEALLLGGPYNIPEQQRDIEWDAQNGREFIEDPGKVFLEELQPEHSVEDIRNYSYYPYNNMTIDVTDGRKDIIDGYQRMTASILTAIIINHKLKGKVSWIQNLIFTDDYGKKVFRVTSSDEEFMNVLNSIYNNTAVDISKLNTVNAINLYKLYSSMQAGYPSALDGENLLKFAYFIFKNSFVSWTEGRNANTHAQFAGANHRGKGVEDFALLKNEIMGKIEDKDKKREAGLALKSVSDMLNKELPKHTKGSGGNSVTDEFLITSLRAKHAQTVRVQKNDMSGNWDEMLKPYKWAASNLDTICSDPHLYATKVIPTYAKYYIEIYKSTKEPVVGLEPVFIASALNVPWFTTALLSVVDYNSGREANYKNINMVAEFFSTFIALRTINNLNTIGGSFIPHLVTIIRQIRGLAGAELAMTLHAIINHESTPTFNAEMPSYNTISSANRNRLTVMLARAENMLRVANQQPSVLTNQLSSKGSAKLQLDHAMPQSGYEEYKGIYPTLEEYTIAINKFGNLTVATGSANAGWKDMSMAKKLTNLGHQSIMGATLNGEMFDEEGRVKSGINAGLRRFLDENKIVFPIVNANGLTKSDIDKRTEITLKLISIAYSSNNIFKAAEMTKEEAESLIAEDKMEELLNSYDVDGIPNLNSNDKETTVSKLTGRVRELISHGTLRDGDVLVPTGKKYSGIECTVNADGTFNVYGDTCYSPNSAANRAIKEINTEDARECKSGWEFWGIKAGDKVISLAKMYQGFVSRKSDNAPQIGSCDKSAGEEIIANLEASINISNEMVKV